MDKNYYKEYYVLEREHWWFRARAKIISNLISKRIKNQEINKLKILNIGAATGKTSEILSEFGTVTSLEYDKECCDFANDTLNLNIINGSILELPFADGEFDMVCALDVIEHVEDDFLAVSEMKRVCKSGGLVVVTVPAFMLLWSNHDEVNHHFRRYTMSNLKEIFSKLNLTTVKATYFNTLLFLPILAFRLISKLIPAKFIRVGAGSDATLHTSNSISSKVLYQIFKSELALLNLFNLPFGVSIFIISSKK
jgi:2-polyprenyl-3-methyl-5-hydroxy-6-metoxy-1,4-benzoquinol methylase